LARAFWSVWRQHQVAAGPSEANQPAKGFRAASGAGPPHGVQPEPRDDPADQLAIPVLADQDMGFETGDGQRHHQLLRVPKGKDRPLSLSEYPGHVLQAVGSPAHGALQ